MTVVVFMRLLLGYLAQVVPFAVLALYPYRDQLRLAPRSAAVLTAALVGVLGVLFAGVGCSAAAVMPATIERYNVVNAAFFVALLPCLGYYWALVRAPWQEKLFIFDFALTSAWAVTAACNLFATGQLDAGGYDGLPYRSWSLWLIMGANAVALPLLTAVLHRCFLPVRDGLSVRESSLLAALSAVLFVVLAAVFACISFSSLVNAVAVALFCLLLALVLFVYGAVLLTVRAAHDQMAARRVADDATLLAAVQAEQYENLCAALETDRRVRHDVRHNLVAIRGRLAADDTAEAMRQLDDYLALMEPLAVTRYGTDDTLNALLSHYRRKAEEADVAFEAHVALPGKAPLPDTDLAVVVGNALENALAAAVDAAPEGRFIRVAVAQSGRMLAITVDNGFGGALAPCGGAYRSTKPNHDGLGLRSITAIAERHAGTATFSHESNVFHTSVMLQGA